MEYKFIAIPDCLFAIGTCFVLSAIFVSSLYVWNSHYDRDHASTIKKRFLSVFVVMLISPAFVYIAINKDTLERKTLWQVLGLRTEGLFQALLIPLFLTMVLFTGPIYMQVCNGLLNVYLDPNYWSNNVKNLIWLRNHIVAPLAEEFTYRSCMLPILLQCFTPLAAVFICPLFFGADVAIYLQESIFLIDSKETIKCYSAISILSISLLLFWGFYVSPTRHFHHVIENMRKGMRLKHAILISCFHCFYTTIFGIYSAYLLFKTGHFASAFIVHAFCNHMGFPEFHELKNYGKKQQVVASIMFIAGFVLWCFLLNPLTEPELFCNYMHL